MSLFGFGVGSCSLPRFAGARILAALVESAIRREYRRRTIGNGKTLIDGSAFGLAVAVKLASSGLRAANRPELHVPACGTFVNYFATMNEPRASEIYQPI